MTHPSPNFRRPAFIELLNIGVRRSIIAPIDVVPLFPLVAPLFTFVGNGFLFFCISGSPVRPNKVDRVEERSWFQSEGPMITKARV